MLPLDRIIPIPTVPEIPELTGISMGPPKPVVMLPVRVETRSFLTPGGGTSLHVRVYPDKVHIDTHEKKLTEQEVIWGKHFWEQSWRAANDAEAGRTAWRQLVERLGTGRAAWVARELAPNNPNDRPTAPVPNDISLPKQILFPTVETQAEAWMRSPLASALPARWHVFGFTGGQLTLRGSGNPIPRQLAAGPDPQFSVDNIPENELAIDDGMKWMVDFAEAEKVGMGIRIPLNAANPPGFDFLLVLGTRETEEGKEAEELAALFDAHHYTDGLSFVRQGTPTNNTPDATSGFSSFDPGDEASYLAERTTQSIRAADGSNADLLTEAFGFGSVNAGIGQTFTRIANATVKEHSQAGHMNRALWSSTWGYFLSQMMAGSPLTPGDCDWARSHFTEHVRAPGLLPAIRIGKQPYGILPVTSLKSWKPKPEPQQDTRALALRDFLLRLWTIWRANLQEVPRVNRTPNNPDRDFADILSMDGLSPTYTIRHLTSKTYLRAVWSLWPVKEKSGESFWWDKLEQLTKAALKQVGLDWEPRLLTTIYSGSSTSLKGPVIEAGGLSETSKLQQNYIQLLLEESDFENIWEEKFSQFQPKAFLYSLLRHSLLWEYAGAGGDLIVFQATNSDERFFVAEPEIVTRRPQIWSRLNQPLQNIAADSLWKFLFGLESLPADPQIARRVAALLEFRQSLAQLKDVSTASLRRLVAGTLDLCSHRLDAWISSFANKRLAEIRQDSATGLLIGGYGWVVNWRPKTAAQIEVSGNNPQALTDNPGLTHAPSLGHAATVAVLRSGHLTHSAASSASANLLAIDLSSERVRLAEWLLDGVRQGQPIGALLGYRFERRLQDALMGDYIPVFREVAPLVAKRLPETADASSSQSVESIAANNVVDGLALNSKWNKIKATVPPFPADALHGRLRTLLFDVAKKPGPGRFTQVRAGLEAELDLLDNAVDAVSDALIAESVHQAVQGNPLRTASTLEAIASGGAPPPELEVARTPRTGHAIVHRLVTLFSAKTELPPVWSDPLVPFRANAEPHLNAWAAKLLGDPSRVRCVVERLDPATGSVLDDSKELLLSELRLSPLDFVYASEGSRDLQPSEIEQRIFCTLKQKFNDLGPNDVLRIKKHRAEGSSIGDVSYSEFMELVRTTRAVITNGRGIDASELNLPERNQSARIDFPDLTTRADQAEQSLRHTLTGLRNQSSGSNLKLLRELILQSSHFGIAGAVPIVAKGDSPSARDALVIQSASIEKELEKRLEELLLLKNDFNPNKATDEDKRNHLLARLSLIFGKAFVALPRFTAGNSTELQKALAASKAIQDNDALAVVTWFQRASRVREPIARLHASITYAEALETGEKLNLRVVQLPHDDKARWVGLPLLSGKELDASGLSLVIQSDSHLDVQQSLAGLLIEEWVEVVPNRKETTAVTFQYDQPNAAAPQSILLAVPPAIDEPWSLWSLTGVLLETLDLARIRAVDFDSLDELGHFLPAVYLAVNTARDTPAIDFST